MKKLKLLLIICLVLFLIPISVNFFVIYKNNDIIYSEREIDKKYDIALVLGCSVLKIGEPSKMLRDRLNAAIYLYENDIVDKVLVSGDHNETYTEVLVMKDYLINHNVSIEDILIDYEGYSTGDSLINYEKFYKDKSVIIVTQEYHLYRALFIAENLNLNAAGVYAKPINYSGQFFREIREILARNKDFFVFEF